MALTARQRSSIYQRLSPVIGDEETEALLSQFPAHDLDVPATKEFVRAQIAGVRAELHAEVADLRVEIADLRTEVRTGIAGLRTEIGGLRSEIAGVRDQLAGQEARSTEQLRQVKLWMAGMLAGALPVGMGLAAAIASLAG